MSNTSNWRELTRQEVIIDPIQNDPRTLRDGGLLGWSTQNVFNHAIRFGQANFDESIENLTGLDRARLYAWLNQPGHLEELDVAFSQLLRNSENLGKPYIFDIGCGPFTAGLSLAKAIGPKQDFHYYGIDIYKSMRDLGLQLATTAKKYNGLHYASQFEFHHNLDEIKLPSVALNNTKIFITSYLLASDTLEVEPLTKSIQRVSENYSRGQSLLLYTNSTNERARQKYPKFKDLMLAAGFECHTEDISTISYKNKTRNIHYALFYKPANQRYR